MWVSKAQLEQTIRWQNTAHLLQGELDRLRLENARYRADMDWFKFRLSQVERERGQLIQAAIGVKVSVPEFVPVSTDAEEGAALHDMPDLSTIGHDAKDDGPSDAEPNPGIDYTMMPGYKGK